MDSHTDREHYFDDVRARESSAFMNRLRERADETTAAGKSKITGGDEGEQELASWKHKGMQVTHLPDDEQGILRISAGGGPTPVPLHYCVVRGSVGACVVVLEKAIAALKKCPE